MSKDVRYHGFVTMQSRGVVALPRELRKRMHLDEPGAQVEMTEREDGVIEVRAQMAVPVTLSWFWRGHTQGLIAQRGGADALGPRSVCVDVTGKVAP